MRLHFAELSHGHAFTGIIPGSLGSGNTEFPNPTELSGPLPEDMETRYLTADEELSLATMSSSIKSHDSNPREIENPVIDIEWQKGSQQRSPSPKPKRYSRRPILAIFDPQSG